MRSLVPADSLVYLEANDLAAALQPIVDSKPFQQAAKSKPDFAVLKGVQLAVAVTGFETTEEKLTDENSVGRVQPRFVAVADTHAWNYQAVAFADQKLGQFVTDIYGADVTQGVIDKNNGKYFTWTSNDGRKSYAQVTDSIIYFGNDESAIDKCLAVRRGEADSIAKTGKVQTADARTLASGYISTDGVAQIASIIGLKLAAEIGEDAEVQSAIAGILPQLIRGSITEVSWTATNTDHGIEDKYSITMPVNIAETLNDTMASMGDGDLSIFRWLPGDVSTATIYNFRNSLIAWRFLMFPARKTLDPLSTRAVEAIIAGMIEEYGIADADRFLEDNPGGIVTARFSDDEEGSVVMRNVSDVRKVDSALIKELQTGTHHDQGDISQTKDGDLAKFYRDGKLIFGSASAVRKLYSDTGPNTRNLLDLAPRTFDPKSAVVTIGNDNETAAKVSEFLLSQQTRNVPVRSTYSAETKFTKTGIERRTISDFGLIGSIIAQLAAD